MKNNNRISSSYKDPSGFVYTENNEIFRQVNKCYKPDYDLLIQSGLYDSLVQKGLIVSHQEISTDENPENPMYKILKPTMIDFVSYPYEWSFSMLKDAALLTLQIQKESLNFGMSLKDASAYNVQFQNGKPVFIDTLSFEKNNDKPWVAYGQFCRHFLAPLLLMSECDIRLQSLLKNYIDGVPLDLASRLLPLKTRLNFGIMMHIHLHAAMQSKYEDSSKATNNAVDKVGQSSLSVQQKIAITENLIALVNSIKWKPQNTEWGDYYSFTNYSDDAMKNKAALVSEFVDRINPSTCWDMGANNGYFTRIAVNKGIKSAAFDIDPVAVEKNYMYIKKENELNLLPLLMDLTNPSPSIGWNCEERDSLVCRQTPDLVMALALIHHLAISNNVPLLKIAEFFAGICKFLIIEFVPKSDSKVKLLLSTREDIFAEYDVANFEKYFSSCFSILEKQQIKDSDRILYLMKNIKYC